MKKILFFIGTLEKGGAERVVSILSSELANRDYYVEILKYYNSDNTYRLSDKVKVNSIEANTKSDSVLTNLKWLKKYFNDYDLIISFLAPFNMLALWANRNNNVPIIVADRNDPNKVPSRSILRTIRNFLYKRYSDGVVVQTDDNKKYFNDIKDKTTVIYNPIEINVDTDNIDKENLIVSVGRLIPQKNQLMMIEAFSEIIKDYPDYKLIIYGEGSDREILEDRIRQLNINDSVLLPGNVDDVLEKIKKAKLFLLTSKYEGMPNALIEALCLGIPSVSTKVSGANQLIIDGENGYLIDQDDTKELVNKSKLILADDMLQKKMSNNARKLKEELSVDKITDEWIDFINRYIK